MLKLAQAGLLLALIGFIGPVKAALLIEPVVGYNLGSKLEFEGGNSYSGGSGAAFGGRLGYQQLGFQLGVDYLNSTLDMDDNDIGKDVKMSEWAGFIGFEFPILLRVYAGYIFSATGDSELNGADLELKKGSGTKVGLGFTGLPFVDINLEFRQGTFDEAKLGSATIDDKTDYQSYLISLSLPFNL